MYGNKKREAIASLFFCDRGGILTPNPQSRNLMRYTIAPRSQFSFNNLNKLRFKQLVSKTYVRGKFTYYLEMNK